VSKFASQARSRIMQIHYQLATAKKGSLSITKYFQSFKAMCDNLAAAKHHLHDFESISYLLAGLGSDYDPFVTSITTRLDPLSPQMKSMVIFLPMRCGSNITFLPLSLPCQWLIFLPELHVTGPRLSRSWPQQLSRSRILLHWSWPRQLLPTQFNCTFKAHLPTLWQNWAHCS